MNNDLISRSALIKRFEDAQQNMSKSVLEVVFFDAVLGMVDNAPAVDAEPVRHGVWLESNPLFKGIYQCSACGNYAAMSNGALVDGRKDYYCLNCGAKMRGDGDD